MDQAVASPATSPIEPPETESRFSNSFLRLRKHLMRKVGEAIVDYGMIEEGDVVMVCVSGGKDSFTLLSMLLALRFSPAAKISASSPSAQYLAWFCATSS